MFFYNISPYIYFASECHIEETHGGANTKLYDSAGKAANLFFCVNHVCDACEVQPEAKKILYGNNSRFTLKSSFPTAGQEYTGLLI